MRGLLFFVVSCSAYPLAPTHLLANYQPGTWIENLAVRRNGSILFTSLTAPGNVHTLNPIGNSDPVEIAAFPGFNSTLGIVETVADTFYVIASNFSFHTATTPFVNTIWRMTFEDAIDMPSVQKLGEYPSAKLLNGMTTFNDTLLLASDSMLGVLWAIDTRTGSAEMVAQDSLMFSSGGNGINGVHFCDDTLFFTNYDHRTFNKVALDRNARQVGNVTVLGTSAAENGILPPFDDFAIAPNGDAFIADESGNGIQRVSPWNGVSLVAGNVNSTEIAQPTAAKFGRTAIDRGTLYVTTAGGLSGELYVNGSLQDVGAQIVAVDLSAQG